MTRGNISERQLKDEYRKRVASKLDLIEDIVAALNPGPFADTLEKLSMAVHKIHGSAGSFGLDDASRIAAEWELWMRSVSTNGILSENEIQRMKDLLENLKRALKPGASHGSSNS